MEVQEKIKPIMGKEKSTGRSAVIETYNAMLYGTQDNPYAIIPDSSTPAELEEVKAEMEKGAPVLLGASDIMKSFLGYKRQIEGEGDAADFVRENFAGLEKFYDYLSQITEAIKLGFSVTEIVWGRKITNTSTFKYLYFKELRDWSPGKFEFSNDDRLKLILDDGTSKFVDEKTKFKVLSYNIEYGNRYGRGKYYYLYLPAKYIKFSTMFWSIFIEREAGPDTIAQLKEGMSATPEEKDEIDRFLKNRKCGTSLRLESPYEISLLQAGETAGNNYEKFIENIESVIALVMTGNPENLNIIRSGSYAKEKEKRLLRKDIENTYITWLEGFINDVLIKLLVDANFTNVKEYPKWRIIPPKEAVDKEVFMKTMKEAAIGGMNVPLSHMQEQLGVPEWDGKEELYKPPPTAPTTGESFANALIKKEYDLWNEDKKSLKTK